MATGEEPARSTLGPIARARFALTALETLDRLTESGQPPTDDDLAALRGWPGWGPLAPALQPGVGGTWAEIGQRLRYLLPPEAIREAEQATYNAFYTPAEVADGAWRILHGLGFAGGRVLEPGCGAGAFMATTPAELTGQVRWLGVERDPTTARIAALLHPDAEVVNERLERARLAAASVDAVIGNVPFGDVTVYDPAAPKPVTDGIHNYFIWRSIQALRPGGVAVLITSRYTLDAADPAARAAFAEDADLLGAIRLPGTALEPGGTRAVTDILVLRRRKPGEAARDPQAWMDTADPFADHPDIPYSEVERRVNAWLLARPEMVLGELTPDTAVRYGFNLAVTRPDGAPSLEIDLAAAADRIVAEAVGAGLAHDVDPAPAPLTALSTRDDGRKEGSFHIIDGAAMQVVDGQLVAVTERRQGEERPLSGKALAELTALCQLRDAVTELLAAEADHSRPDEALTPMRQRLERLYDAYVAAYGPLNRCTLVSGEPDPETGFATVSRRRPAMGGFRRDPDYATVLALEIWDDDTATATKAPILTRRVNKPAERVERAETAAEALALCLDEHGRLDLPTVARLLNIDVANAPAELGDLVYADPATGEWITSDEYLSGNVRAKLEASRAAAEADPERWARNVAALEKVLPADRGPEWIRPRLGASWIPASDVQAFIGEVIGGRCRVSYERVTATWEVAGPRAGNMPAAATTEWGTDRVDAYRLVELALNGQPATVYDTVVDDEGRERRVRNQDETLLAVERQQALRERFGQWVWEDPERTDRLVAEYNRRFRSHVPRRFTGAHLTFPGLAADATPYPHQLDMVARSLATPMTLCGHGVGAGKTLTMFLTAVKAKQLGLARKPLIIVPNHLLEQIARDGARFLPGAQILMTTKDDLKDARARKLFAARCATGDWDAVVMTHQAFAALPVHPRTQADYVNDMAARLREALANHPDDGSRRIKQIAKQIDRMEAHAQDRLAHATDDGVYFEHLGVDFIQVDEAHYFKNLFLGATTEGFQIAPSKRATDLDLKLNWLRERGGRAVMYTGTPVPNSLIEVFVWQHYLQPERLEELDLAHPDAWARTYVKFETGIEIAPDGASFRLKTRPTGLVNKADLRLMLSEVADIRAVAGLNLSRPDPVYTIEAIPGSPLQRAYVRWLGERADRISGNRTDNMLKICSDGRKAALDMELVGIPDPHPGKVDAVVRQVVANYHATKDLQLPGDEGTDRRGGLQIIFCDLGTPNAKKGDQAYGKIRAGLVAGGIPATRIRFIHQATTDTAKAALFSSCRAGEVSVLIGSSDKLGVGTNVQTRVTHMHHVDPTWRPAEIEQREGRGIRAGNLNPTVGITRYVTEGSFDSYMWQTLERKQKGLDGFLYGDDDDSEMEEISDAALSAAEAKALASGNPMLLEKAEVDAEVSRLTNLATAHTRNQRRLRGDIETWRRQIGVLDQRVAALTAIAARAAGSRDQAWYTPGGQPIAVDDVPARLAAAVTEATTSRYGPTLTWRDLRITFQADHSQWRKTTLTAKVVADWRHEIEVPLTETWTNKGQHWRIREAITTAVDGAAGTADELRQRIADLHARIADAQARLDQPFAHSDELAAARARRDQVAAALEEAANDDTPDHATDPDAPPRLTAEQELELLVAEAQAQARAALPAEPIVIDAAPAASEAAAADDHDQVDEHTAAAPATDTPPATLPVAAEAPAAPPAAEVGQPAPPTPAETVAPSPAARAAAAFTGRKPTPTAETLPIPVPTPRREEPTHVARPARRPAAPRGFAPASSAAFEQLDLFASAPPQPAPPPHSDVTAGPQLDLLAELTPAADAAQRAAAAYPATNTPAATAISPTAPAPVRAGEPTQERGEAR
ncbi:helicase-related protein [Planosporangium sp. 12N6]|uniref:helicase-related protein n=1 Tax=Planosporangium spinosum TaxID=3402278 RepID=UPI003CF2BC81